jgi:hypothetical protein
MVQPSQTGLGQKDEAIRSLQSAIDLHAPLVILLKVDPRFDSLRRDPRFDSLRRDPRFPKLLQQVNLSE